jgi:hypothetical protein
MKILLEVLPLEKAKHADSDFTEPVQFLFAYPHAGSWMPTFQHCPNEGKYSDKYKTQFPNNILLIRQ